MPQRHMARNILARAFAWRRCPGPGLGVGCPAMGKETGNTPDATAAGTPSAGTDAAARRRARAAQALRANLKRRKAQARQRGAGEPDAAGKPDPGS